MKQKRGGYIWIITMLVCTFSLCYYWSYHRSFGEVRRQNEEFIRYLREGGSQGGLPSEPEESGGLFLTENAVADAAQESETEIGEGAEVEVLVGAQDTILPGAFMTLERVDLDKGETIKEQLPVTSEFVGLTRAEVLSYLEQYMQEVPIEEYERGLTAYELVSFSKRSFTLRKTYHASQVPYRFYLTVKNDLVVVYYSDKKTVYEYTGLRADALSEESRTALSYGIYATDLEQLYDLLASLTS